MRHRAGGVRLVSKVSLAGAGLERHRPNKGLHTSESSHPSPASTHLDRPHLLPLHRSRPRTWVERIFSAATTPSCDAAPATAAPVAAVNATPIAAPARTLAAAVLTPCGTCVGRSLGADLSTKRSDARRSNSAPLEPAARRPSAMREDTVFMWRVSRCDRGT